MWPPARLISRAAARTEDIDDRSTFTLETRCFAAQLLDQGIEPADGRGHHDHTAPPPRKPRGRLFRRPIAPVAPLRTTVG